MRIRSFLVLQHAQVLIDHSPILEVAMLLAAATPFQLEASWATTLIS
ncbi:MAG: hypothetical protein ACKVJE_08000 [Pseudomonadales bacterium]